MNCSFLPKLLQESIQRLSLVRLGNVDLSASVGRPPDDENPVKKQNVGDYLRAYSAWIWAKSAPWIFFSSKNALSALVPTQQGMSGVFKLKLCQKL